MIRGKKARRPKPKARQIRGGTHWHMEPGMCFVCSCTEDNACPEGCWWANEARTLCSSCADAIGAAVIECIGSRR